MDIHGTGMSSLLFHVDTSSIMGDIVLWFIVCWFCSVVRDYVAGSSKNVSKFAAFADTSDYPFDDVFILVRRTVASLIGCTVLGWATFLLCRCRHTSALFANNSAWVAL